MTARLLLGLSLGVLLSALPARAQADASPLRFVRWAVLDPVEIAAALQPEGAALGTTLGVGLAGGLALSALADAELSEEAQEGYTGPARGLLDVVNELGDPRAHTAAGVLFLGTLLTADVRLQDAAFTSVQAASYAGVVTVALKRTFGRARPNAHIGPYDFQPFSGSDSFPSGHATLAFALVTPWVVYYPGPATYALLVVASGTAVARVALEHHWPSDVLAGAAIGASVGYLLARHHRGVAGGAAPVRLALGDDGAPVLAVVLTL